MYVTPVILTIATGRVRHTSHTYHSHRQCTSHQSHLPQPPAEYVTPATLSIATDRVHSCTQVGSSVRRKPQCNNGRRNTASRKANRQPQHQPVPITDMQTDVPQCSIAETVHPQNSHRKKATGGKVWSESCNTSAKH